MEPRGSHTTRTARPESQVAGRVLISHSREFQCQNINSISTSSIRGGARRRSHNGGGRDSRVDPPIRDSNQSPRWRREELLLAPIWRRRLGQAGDLLKRATARGGQEPCAGPSWKRAKYSPPIQKIHAPKSFGSVCFARGISRCRNSSTGQEERGIVRRVCPIRSVVV